METDTQSRFAYLLQPIRDLTRNWDVDVASQLEGYISEIERITISFDGGTTMNFAEAALLIQGSTCVYSKKVEYLYALVYQTLDLVASKKKLAQASSVDDQGRDSDVSFQNKNDELLALDDIQEATNIDMMEKSHKSELKVVNSIPRTPMSLIPLQESEKASATPLLSQTGDILGSKLDFKMNASSVHSSGALLLEPMNQFVIEVKMADKEPIILSYDTPGPFAIATEVDGAGGDGAVSMDVGTVSGTDGAGGDGTLAMDAGPVDMGGYSDDECGGLEPESSPAVTLEKEQARPRRSARVRLKKEAKVLDPWQLLDSHKPSSSDHRPFKKGSTVKLVPSLCKSSSRKRKKDVATSLSEPLAEFMLRTFYSCSAVFPKNPLKAPSSSEFEGLYWAEQKIRKTQRRRDNITLAHLHQEPALVEDDLGDDREEDDPEDYQPLGQDNDYDDDGGMVVGDGEGVDRTLEGLHTDMKQFVMTSFQGVEPMALDESALVTRNYEDLVRTYVDKTLTSALAYAQETELSKRVQEWEDRMKPTLASEDSRPSFDIHQYGAKLLDEFGKEADVQQPLHFSELAKHREQYEVCRLFLASLQLANDYNIDIECSGEGEEAVDTMSLKLLSTQMGHEKLSSYLAPSLHPPQH